MTKIQFTGTVTQPHRNQNFRQFNNDQYCNLSSLINSLNKVQQLLKKHVDMTANVP